MTSLAIDALDCDCILGRDSDDVLPLILERVSFDRSPLCGSWRVKDATLIRRNARSLILRGTVESGQESFKAVLKLDPTCKRENALLFEAAAYELSLTELQGSIVPVFYGCFQATLGQGRITCLVMEDCGEVMQDSLADVDSVLGCVLMVQLPQ